MPKQQKKRVVRQVRVQALPARSKKNEVTAVGRALRALGGLGGGALGGYLGNPGLGSAAGSGIGAMVSKWLGQGDYVVSSNSLLSSVKPDGTIPAMHKDGQSVIVRHKEFLGEIRGSTDFVVQKRYPLNPGDQSTFPWLSAIAAQYTEYKIRGMIFHYVPTSGMAVNSTNPALGSVMIQTSYRATEAAPASKIEMMNEYWATEARPSETFCHPIECDPKENPFNVQYVRNSSVSSSENILMYDLGVTTVCTTGCPATGNVLGDLWCTYEIELKKPKLASINTENSLTASILGQGTAVTAPAPFDINTRYSSINGIVATVSGFAVSGEVQGTYLVAFSGSGLSALSSSGINLGSGITVAFSSQVNAAGSSSAVSVAVVRIAPTSSTRNITWAISSLTSLSGTVMYGRITEYNSNATY